MIDYSWSGAHIETLCSPADYSEQQIAFACLVAAGVDELCPPSRQLMRARRGKLVLCIAPANED